MYKKSTASRAVQGFALLLSLIGTGAEGQAIDTDWVPDDIVVSNPERTMLDPEFDPVSGYVAWQSGPSQDQRSGLLLVARIDGTGDFLDPLTDTPLRLGGQGLELDSDLVSIEVTRNGPEFALAAGGSRLLYTKLNVFAERSIAQLIFDGAGWLPMPMERAQNRITPEGSKIIDDAYPRMAYFGANREQLAVRFIDLPFTERIANRVLNGSNFMPDEAAMLATSEVGDGDRQVFYWDYLVNEITQITDDRAVKLRSPEPWVAPELSGETVFAVLVRRDGELFIRMYNRDAEQRWIPYAEVRTPDPAKPYLRSPRPFVFEGVSYLLFRTQRVPGDDVGSDVWIVNADPDPSRRVYRRVNEAGEARRADPEAFITETGPVVYYTELTAGSTKRTRRCRTGILPGEGLKQAVPAATARTEEDAFKVNDLVIKVTGNEAIVSNRPGTQQFGLYF